MAVPSISLPADTEVFERCLSTTRADCVVYDFGAVTGSELVYQLQGTGLAGEGDRAFCRGGYCAVAIFERGQQGQHVLKAHIESAEADWYEVPKLHSSPAGPLIVARSNGLGTGLYNDDIVLRQDGAELVRIDVQLWKDEARRLVTDANSYFDWQTDYRAFVGETGLANKTGSARDSDGSVRVFLVLEGATLKVGSEPVRFPRRQ